jgi:hypothetical protein
MSLLRLLTNGKTLVGLKKPEHRYHLPGETALPKFGGKKNPFRATVFPDKAETAETDGSAAVPKAVAVEATAPIEPTPPCPQGAAPGFIPSTLKAEAAAPVQAREPAVVRTSPFKALLLWGRAKKANPALALAGRPLVQGELSLDRVKVVRNDLSESDFEIVTSGRAQREAATIASSVGLPVVTAPDEQYVAAVGKM